MHIASRSNVSMIRGKLVTEASEIGLRPGRWPEMIAVLDENHAGFTFTKSDPILMRGELAGYNYRAGDGSVLTVFND